MFVFRRTDRVLAGSFKKLLEFPRKLAPYVWKKNTATGGSKEDSCRCDMYDTRKFSHNLPKFDTMTCFEPLPNIPTGVFRTVAGEERLGPGAAKCCYYQNPEYFSFHHMTYYDFHLILKECRQPAPKSNRKP